MMRLVDLAKPASKAKCLATARLSNADHPIPVTYTVSPTLLSENLLLRASSRILVFIELPHDQMQKEVDIDPQLTSKEF